MLKNVIWNWVSLFIGAYGLGIKQAYSKCSIVRGGAMARHRWGNGWRRRHDGGGGHQWRRGDGGRDWWRRNGGPRWQWCARGCDKCTWMKRSMHLRWVIHVKRKWWTRNLEAGPKLPKYKNKVEKKFEDGDAREAWQGLNTMMGRMQKQQRPDASPAGVPSWPTFHRNTTLLLSSCLWNRSIKHWNQCLSNHVNLTPFLHLSSLTALHTCFLPSLTSSTHPRAQVPFPKLLRQLLFILFWKRTNLTQMTWKTIALSLTFRSFPSSLNFFCPSAAQQPPVR